VLCKAGACNPRIDRDRIAPQEPDPRQLGDTREATHSTDRPMVSTAPQPGKNPGRGLRHLRRGNVKLRVDICDVHPARAPGSFRRSIIGLAIASAVGMAGGKAAGVGIADRVEQAAKVVGERSVHDGLIGALGLVTKGPTDGRGCEAP
jgi:hypothetical protein